MEWPTQNLDLDTKDNLWVELKKSVYTRNLSNLVGIEKFVEKDWAKIIQNICLKLNESYPKRQQCLVEYKGRVIVF